MKLRLTKPARGAEAWASRPLLDTLQTSSRHLPETRHNPYTFQTSRHLLYTFQTPTRHIGPSPLEKLVRVLILVVLVTGENKVNSYSKQLKLSWVCKSEWSLTTGTKTTTYG